MPALSLPPGGLSSLVARPLMPRVKRTIMLIRRRNRALSPVAERVWTLVRETVEATGAGTDQGSAR
jgi:hypothetical protein